MNGRNKQSPTAVLSNCQDLLAAGQVDEAIDILVKKYWTDLSEGTTECIDLLIECCVVRDSGSRVGRLLNHLSALYSRFTSGEPMEVLTELLFKNLRALLTACHAEAERLRASPDKAVSVWCASSNTTVETYVKRFVLGPCHSNVRLVLQKAFVSTDFGRAKKSFKAYSKYVHEMVALCREFGLHAVMELLAPQLCKKVEYLLAPAETRREVVEADCLHTYLCAVLALLSENGAWEAATKVMFTLKRYLELVSEDPTGAARVVTATVMKQFADTLLTGDVIDYHALALQRGLLEGSNIRAGDAASQQKEHLPLRPEQVTQAVLAALCADPRREADRIQGRAVARGAMETLFDHPDVTREGLLDVLLSVPAVTAAADAAALRLAQLLEAPADAQGDYTAAAADVAAVFAQYPALAPHYAERIQQALLQHQIAALSLTHNSVQRDALTYGSGASAGGLSDATYINDIEPTLLADSDATAVVIDAATRTVTLRNAVNVKTVKAFAAISSELYTRAPAAQQRPVPVAAAATTTAAPPLSSSSPAPASPAPVPAPAVTPEALLAALKRTQNLHRLQIHSQSTADKRTDLREKKLREAEEQKKAARAERERKNRAEKDKQQIQAEIKAYEAAMQVERFTLTLRKLRAAHKQFTANDTALARLPAAEFETQVTAILAKLHTEEAEKNKAELMKAHLLERARRRAELPHLKASTPVASRQVIAKNIISRIEKDEKEKEVLRKYFAEAEKLEREMQSFQERHTNTGKLDDQQRRIQEEMERIRRGRGA